MIKILIALLITVLYINVFQLPYAVWTFPLTQNWFTDNGLILFQDVIYHHTPLPLFLLYFLSKIFGNGASMLQISSFLLSTIFGLGVYLVGAQISQKIGKVSFVIFLFTFPAMFNNFNIEEMTAALLTLFSMYFFTHFLKAESVLFLFYAGIFFGLGVMGKQSAVGIVFAFTIVLLWFSVKKKRTTSIKKAFLFLVVGGAVGVSPVLIYYFIHNALGDFLYWNILFNLTIYPQQTQPRAISDGLFYGGWIMLSILPGFILLWKRELKRDVRLKLLLVVLATLFLSPSLLPSFHAYKLLIFYPYAIIIWSSIWMYRRYKILLFFLVLGLITMLLPMKAFYFDYFPQNLFHREYILDYGEDELKVVEWIKKNTDKNEKIMNLGNHYITTLSERLPKNRYVYIFPWLVMPYDTSTKEILSDPPRIVVLDKQVLEDWPVLKEWGFVRFVKASYRKKTSYGTYEIYTAQ